MAIEKTVFTGTTQAANAPEVYEFLNANKAGYFDSVVMDGANNAITCYVGETAALVMNFDNVAKSVVMTAANGSSGESTKKDLRWLYAIKTSKGLYLNGVSIGTSSSTFDLIISTNNSGDPIMVTFGNMGSTTSNRNVYTADILHGTVWNLMQILSGTYAFITTGVTTLTQIPLSQTAESYASDVYLTFFGQYIGTAGKLAANGKEYYYTGHIALGD